MDAKAYIRRGQSSPDLSASETAGVGNSLSFRAYPNGVPPNGVYFVVKVPLGVVAAVNLTCTLKDAAESAAGSGIAGAYAAVAEGTAIVFTGITAAARMKYAKFTQSREFVSADFTLSGAGNFGKVAAYLTNTVPYYN